MGNKKSMRYLNGYRVVYLPNHPKAMKSKNWSGYVYEHIAIAEQGLGRSLLQDEIVHHLDGNRDNNRNCNLLVLKRSEHSKIEHWLLCGAPSAKVDGMNRINSGKPKWKSAEYCLICGLTLQHKQKNCCSKECSSMFSRKVERPSREQLEEQLKVTSVLSLGKKYGVSDNAIRKWIKQYGIHMAILSQVTDTSVKGAETNGEVQSS
jgi:predicted nucleic acid-binding Zn ribbon protein